MIDSWTGSPRRKLHADREFVEGDVEKASKEIMMASGLLLKKSISKLMFESNGFWVMLISSLN